MRDKLKTLKEMPEALSTVEHPFKEWETWRFIEGVLKQELKKILKSDTKDLCNFLGLVQLSSEQIQAIDMFILKWGNITREDLK